MQEKRGIKKLLILIFKLTKNFVVELFDPKLSFYAASMSWATLFFIIPLLVITLSIILHTQFFSKYYEKIHTLIAQSLAPASSAQIMNWIDTFVANASQMGLIGTIYVIVAAVLFFKDFDYIVNDIFSEERRGILKAFLLYGGLLLFIPIAIAASIWLFTILGSKFHLAPILLQFFIIWAIIFIIFKLTPKESIPLNVLAISSFITTLVWFIAKNIFVFYIIYNKTYTTIYGTVSIVLFTFLWIYISWTIFIHGLQLCSMLMREDENENFK